MVMPSQYRSVVISENKKKITTEGARAASTLDDWISLQSPRPGWDESVSATIRRTEYDWNASA